MFAFTEATADLAALLTDFAALLAVLLALLAAELAAFFTRSVVVSALGCGALAWGMADSGMCDMGKLLLLRVKPERWRNVP